MPTTQEELTRFLPVSIILHMTDREPKRQSQTMAGYPDGDQLLAILNALANPHRLRIIAALSEGPIHVSQLARDVHISRPLLYLHLKKLEAAGLVAGHLGISNDGKAMKFFDVVVADLLITPELISLAVQTLSASDNTQPEGGTR